MAKGNDTRQVATWLMLSALVGGCGIDGNEVQRDFEATSEVQHTEKTEAERAAAHRDASTLAEAELVDDLASESEQSVTSAKLDGGAKSSGVVEASSEVGAGTDAGMTRGSSTSSFEETSPGSDDETKPSASGASVVYEVGPVPNVAMRADTCLELLDDISSTMIVTTPSPSLMVDETDDLATVNDVNYTCRRKQVTEVTEGQNLSALTVDHIVPGLFIHANPVVNGGQVAPITAERSPVELVVAAQDTETTRYLVDDPSLASLQEGVNALVAKIPETRPAILSASISTVSSREELNRSLNISANVDLAMGLEVSAKVGLVNGTDVHQKSVMVSLQAIDYTISMTDDDLAKTSDMFANSEAFAGKSAEDCGGFSADDVPAYVRSVSYGTQVVYLFTSSQYKSWSEFEASLRAAFSGVKADGSIEVEASSALKKVIDSSEVTAIVFGGSEDVAYEAIRNADPSVFFHGRDPKKSVPISYSVHSLNAARIPLNASHEYVYSSERCDFDQCNWKEETRVACEGETRTGGGLFGKSEDATFDCECHEDALRASYFAEAVDQGNCSPKDFSHGSAWVNPEDPTDCRFRVHIGVPGGHDSRCAWSVMETYRPAHEDSYCQ